MGSSIKIILLVFLVSCSVDEIKPTYLKSNRDVSLQVDWRVTDIPLVVKKKYNIWKPTTTGVKTYNHIPSIIKKYGKHIVIFATHDYDEDGPGEYARWSYDNGDFIFSKPSKIFPPNNPMQRRKENSGRVIQPIGFAEDNHGKLYAIGDFLFRDFRNGKNIRVGLGVIAREIKQDMTLGEIFWITEPVEPLKGFEPYPADFTIGDELKSYLSKTENKSPWGHGFKEAELHNWLFVDSLKLVERSGYVAGDVEVLMWRRSDDKSNPFKYFQYKINDTWSNPVITNIPDAPSLTRFKKAGDKYVMIGNINQKRNPLIYAVSDDGFTWVKGFKITEISNTKQMFSGHGKGGGDQYPDFIYVDGKIICAASRRKEEINVFVIQ